MAHTIQLGEHSADVTEHRQEGNIWRSYKVATRTGRVVVEIDTAKLAEYARKALRNRSGTSQIASGAIKFVAYGVKVAPVGQTPKLES
jgi:hypothetical protein